MLEYMLSEYSRTKFPNFQSRKLLADGHFDLQEWKDLVANKIIKVQKGMHCKIYILDVKKAYLYTHDK